MATREQHRVELDATYMAEWVAWGFREFDAYVERRDRNARRRARYAERRREAA